MIKKFRVWDKKRNKYIINGEEGCITNLLRCDGWDMVNTDDYVFEQSTGLKDVSGNEIYECDVVESNYKYAQPKVSQIILEDGNSYILGEDLANGNEMLVSDHIGEIKVIGNVHNN